MAEQPSWFRFTIRAKMFVFGLIPVFAILAVLIYIVDSNDKDAQVENQKLLLLAKAEEAACMMDVDNGEAIAIAKTMAIAQQSVLFGDRQRSMDYARAVLEANPDKITGAYFGYEPNADGADTAAAAAAAFPDPKVEPTQGPINRLGRFLPYWKRDWQKDASGKTLVLEPLVSMEDPIVGRYYGGLKQKYLESGGKVKSHITEPYLYPANAKPGEGVFMVEQTHVIERDGKFVGIAGVDRRLEYLATKLQELKTAWNVDFILVSTERSVIGTTVDSALITKELKSTPYKFLEPYIGKTMASPYFVELPLTDPLLNESCFYAIAPVPAGNWVVIVRRPKSDILAPVKQMRITNVIVAGAGGVIILMILVLLSNFISRRIRSASEAASAVASGNLSVYVQRTSRSDETGDLLWSIHEMTHGLNALVRRVKVSSVQLTSTATQIAATSKQQEATVNSFGASTSQIAAAVKEISATGQELLGTMGEVSEVAAHTAELADSGTASLTSMKDTMAQLSQSTNSISAKLSVIREKAGDINSVVTTITRVADQTNLLSVNAAIEAEKAGEYGRGFLVVSREIRRLADQTAVATLDIEQSVKQMHAAVSAGVMEMDKFSEEVRRSVSGVNRVNAQMAGIIQQASVLSERFESVAEGMRSQTQGAHQINDAMTQLTDGARRTAESLREFNKATSHLREAVDGLRQAIDHFHIAE